MWIHHHRLCSSSTSILGWYTHQPLIMISHPGFAAGDVWSKNWCRLGPKIGEWCAQKDSFVQVVSILSYHFQPTVWIYTLYIMWISIMIYTYIYSCCNWMAIWHSPTCARVPSKWHHEAIVQRAMLRLLHCRARTTWLLWRCRGWFHTSPRHNGGLAGNETKRCWPSGWRLIITSTFQTEDAIGDSWFQDAFWNCLLW